VSLLFSIRRPSRPAYPCVLGGLYNTCDGRLREWRFYGDPVAAATETRDFHFCSRARCGRIIFICVLRAANTSSSPADESTTGLARRRTAGRPLPPTHCTLVTTVFHRLIQHSACTRSGVTYLYGYTCIRR